MISAPSRFVSYLRLSTDGQERSGLGLEAQRQTVVAQAGGALLAEFQEVESVRRVDWLQSPPPCRLPHPPIRAADRQARPSRPQRPLSIPPPEAVWG